MPTSKHLRLLRFEGSTISIGRDPGNDEVIDEPTVSRFHAEVSVRGDTLVIRDLGSDNGTRLNGRLVTEAALSQGSEIVIGGQHLLVESDDYLAGNAEAPHDSLSISPGETVRIGRDPDNDLTLERPTVSRFHVEIARNGEQVMLRDLGSRNGTRVAGKPVKRAVLEPGDEIGIGPYRILFDGESLSLVPERAAQNLRADAVSVTVKKKRILAPTTVSLGNSELVVIIGESGSGKSTLMKLMAGVTLPTDGRVTVNGEPVSTVVSEFGYLPQDEIVNVRLTIREALRYAAQLRLPDDTSAKEIEASIDGVLDQLSLTEHADTRIGSLSGGQRQRAGLAPELLNQPSFLFLDEPTTGLDPGLETRMTRLLRELADRGLGILVVTHATKNLDLCDRMFVMGRGGDICFQGSPREAVAFFGVSSYDDIYTALTEKPAAEWRREFEAKHPVERVEPSPPAVAPPRRRAGAGLVRQATVLARRYARTFSRDRRNVAILIGQAIPIGVVIAFLYQAGIFQRPDGEPRAAAQFLFLTGTTAIWLGSIAAAREIVKEWGVLERERAVGVRIPAYLASKVIVLFSVATLQVALLCAVVFSFRHLEVPPGDYALVVAILLLTSFAAVGMGLLISSLVRSQDQATSFIPIALIPQLLLGGAIVTVHNMDAVMKVISGFVFSRWAFAGTGSAVDMNGRIDELGNAAARAHEFGTSFFSIEPAAAMLILAGFLAFFLLATGFVLQRRTNPRSP
jgi:ABC transport system ATP-binding/permease protein